MQDRSAYIAERFFPYDQLVMLAIEYDGVLGPKRLLKAIHSVAGLRCLRELNLAERIILAIRLNHELAEAEAEP